MSSRPAAMIPYRQGVAGRRLKPISLIFMIVYSALTGVGVALLPATMMIVLAIPLLASVPIILWLLPDGGTPPTKALMTLLVWYIATNVLWPNYLAIDLPGLPWITPTRVVTFALLALALVAYSTSSQLRREIADILNVLPMLKWAFWIFWGMTLLTIGLSNQPLLSLNKWANNQIYWTFMFVLSAWLSSREGMLKRIQTVLIWTTILVALDTIYEYDIGMVPWMNHIPTWLKVDETYLGNVLKTQARAGTSIYRARGTFAVSLICAEYLAIVYPFMIHALIQARNSISRLLILAGMTAVLAAMWFTNARSAMIGFFIAIFAYGGFAALRYWQRNRQSLVGVTVLAMMPVMAAIFFALALTWPRLHNMTFGGAQHQPSSDARAAQWAMGTPKIKANPIGHGAGRGGNALGYANRGGQVTIDTYYLSLLLEYGVVGFAAFMAMFGGQLIYGLRVYFEAKPGEEDLAGPTTIALLNFLVIKAVLSSEFNIPLAFILLGFLFGLAYRQYLRTGQPIRPVWSIARRGIERPQGGLVPA